MKKIYLLLFIAGLFFACVPEDHVLEIEIVNNTSQPVKDIKILTAGDRVSFAADVLPAGQDIAHTLQVKSNIADGKYTFRFTRSNGEQELVQGTYLEEGEGYLKKTLLFSIQEQAVNVDQKVLEVK
ncbi:hypothetical protein [Salinimicrobium sp. TH3]|uniref:hypothetical protein n=1 Tax=Salinimicrobium sp. TH3 TaxID=2997342 RepID=UPI0022757E55|nr:hypothetical protein [Salinimicrobium sp. TH3]MCY2686400.1 hypothetical protein [Salinimicrobium sp. TH3]